MKARLLILCGIALSMPISRAIAGESNTFRSIGKVLESPSRHTTNHDHELRFLRLSDGEEFDIVDSPELVQAHCKSEKNPVIEIEGYRTDKFLFWGGNLVVTNFKTHDDIEVPQMAHVRPETIQRSPARRMNSRL